MVGAVEDGRRALGRRRWEDAPAWLAEAGRQAAFGPDALPPHPTAVCLVGRDEDGVPARQRPYHRWTGECAPARTAHRAPGTALNRVGLCEVEPCGR